MSSTGVPPTDSDITNKVHEYSQAPQSYGTSQHPHPQHPHQSVQESFEQLERDFQKTTDAAVDDGEAATASYLERALHIADSSINTAQTYIQTGKERMNAPHHENHPPPSGLAATFASTAAAALEAASQGLGLAQKTLHEKAPAFPHATQHGPAHPVTSYNKPLGQSVSEHVTSAQQAVQPHADAAAAAVQPHIDAAKSAAGSAAAAAQPHIDAAKATAQPHIDAATAAASPYVDQAHAAVKPHLDAAAAGLQGQIDAVKSVTSSEKPVTQQAQEAAQPHVDAAKDVLSSEKTYAGQEQEAPYTAPAPTAAPIGVTTSTSDDTGKSYEGSTTY